MCTCISIRLYVAEAVKRLRIHVYVCVFMCVYVCAVSLGIASKLIKKNTGPRAWVYVLG